MKKIHLSLLSIFFLIVGCSSNNLDSLFKNAIKNAMETKEENIRKIINITKEDQNVKWNENEEVLMSTLHNYPSSYIEGTTIELKWNAWITSTKEFSNFYLANKSSFIKDSSLRVKQLLGMSEKSPNEYITAYWIKPSYLIRPAYVIDINKPMQITFPSDTTDEYKNWFYNTCGYSYYSDNPTPWTRLGYTYDWIGSKDRYGLSEFYVGKEKRATVKVEKTAKIADFLTYLETI